MVKTFTRWGKGLEKVYSFGSSKGEEENRCLWLTELYDSEMRTKIMVFQKSEPVFSCAPVLIVTFFTEGTTVEG